MAQCQAERRKHPSAMDFYVGALHSKLYSSNRDVDKYTHWQSYASTTSTSVNSSCTRPSQSFRQDPSVDIRPSPSGRSFRESTLTVSSGSEAKLSGSLSYTAGSFKSPQKNHVDAKLVQPTTLSYGGMNNSHQHDDDDTTIVKCLSTRSNGGLMDKEIASSATKVSSLTSIKDEKEGPFASARGNSAHYAQSIVNEGIHFSANSVNSYGNRIPTAASAGSQFSQGNAGETSHKPILVSKPNHNEQVAKFTRSHKSAELGAPSMNKGALKAGNVDAANRLLGHKSAELGAPLMNKGALKAGVVDAANRLYKSGEQIAPKFAFNAGNLRECLTGGLIVGGQKIVSIGSGDTCSSAGSPTATKDGPRWSFAGSTASVDLCSSGGSLTDKDGGRKAFSTNGSSDAGSPTAKDVQSNIANDVARQPSMGSVLKNKDAAIVRGMGNILGGASIHGTANGKFPNDRAGVNDNKPGDGFHKKVEDPTPMLNAGNVRGTLAFNACADGMSSHSRGHFCVGNQNGSAPSGNKLNNGMATKTHIKQIEETRNGFETMDPEDIKNAGNVQYKKGHFAEAVALYDKSIAMCPDHAPYRSNRGAALAGLGRLGEAVLECEEAIKLDPQYLRAHQRAAHLYLRLGLIESAKRHFPATIGKDDAGTAQALQAVERHIARCIEARKSGDWRSVLRESSAAIGVGADSAAQVLGYKSEALLKLHRLGEADAVCGEAQRQESLLQKLGIAPADSFLYVLRAHIETYLGRFEGAVKAAEAAAKIDPRNAEVAALVKKARAVAQTRISGNELFKTGRFFEACALYGEGLESDPTNAVLLCNRAACRSKLGQWEKAIEDCDAALKAQPKYVKALMRRAHCSTKLERWEDALQDYEVLRAKMPNDMEVARGFFDVQVAIKKSRGEEIHKMKFGGEVEEVYNEDQLREVVTFAGISVVQFITRWSDRCCQISPFIDQLCKRFPCVHFVKVDVEENPYLAEIESVTFVPTFKIYRSGQRVKELQGPSEQALESAIKHYSL